MNISIDGLTAEASRPNTQMTFTTRFCPICGSSDQSRVFAEASIDPSKLDEFAFSSRKFPEYMHHRLVECPTCSVLYASPVIALPHLAQAYDEAAFDSGEEAHFAAKTYLRYLRPYFSSLTDRVGTLDIGTGDGAFLEELVNEGFRSVRGVEPSRAPIEAAARDIRPLILHGVFDGSKFEKESMSLVTCFQTFEHLDDPLKMCREAFDILKPGGLIAIVGHDRTAFSARVLGKKSPIFDIEHLQLFSPASSRALLSRVGFEGITVKRISNIYPIHYWTKLFPLPNFVKKPIVRALKASWLGRASLSLSAGNMMAVGYRPLVT